MVDNLISYFENLNLPMDTKKDNLIRNKGSTKSVHETNSQRVKKFITELTEIKRPLAKNKTTADNNIPYKSKTLPRASRDIANDNKKYDSIRHKHLSTQSVRGEHKLLSNHKLKENNEEAIDTPSNLSYKLVDKFEETLTLSGKEPPFEEWWEKHSLPSPQQVVSNHEIPKQNSFLIYDNEQDSYTNTNFNLNVGEENTKEDDKKYHNEVSTVSQEKHTRCAWDEQEASDEEAEDSDVMFGFNDFDEQCDDNYVTEAFNREGYELVITTLEITRRYVRQNQIADVMRDLKNSTDYIFHAPEDKNLLSNENSSSESDCMYQNVTNVKSAESNHFLKHSSSFLYNNFHQSTPCTSTSDIYDEVFDECDNNNEQNSDVIPLRDTSSEVIQLRDTSKFSFHNEKREQGDNFYHNLDNFSDNEETHEELSTKLIVANVTLEKKDKINYVIEEMIKTEQLYVSGLEIVIEKYMPYLFDHTPPNLIGNTTYIFGNIDQIYKKALRFLQLLKENSKSADSLAQLFHDFGAIFELYPLYSKNKPTADMYLKQFSDIVAERQTELNDKLGLASYLLTPIQRLGKYILMLESIQKELKKNDQPLEKINSAVNVIRKVMRKGNDYIAIDSIKGSSLDLGMQGSFIMRAAFNILKPRKFLSTVFLFENAIVFTEKASKNLEQFRYVESIQMSDLSLGKFEEKPNIFHLTNYTKSKKSTQDATYILEAETPKVKNDWTKAIEDKLWTQLQNAKEQQKKISYTDHRHYAKTSVQTSSKGTRNPKRYRISSKSKSKFYDRQNF